MTKQAWARYQFERNREISRQSRPFLVIVTGPPGAGKTTIARRLASDLGLPLLAKDELKEMLADALQVEGLEWSRRVGGASFELLAFLTERLVGNGVSVVVEANFDAARSSEVYRRVAKQHDPVVVQVVCRADPAILLNRYDQRAASGVRHAIHHDTDPSVRQRAAAPHAPLDLPCPIIEVDTTDLAALDLEALVVTVRAAVSSGSTPGGRHDNGRLTGHERREMVVPLPDAKEQS